MTWFDSSANETAAAQSPIGIAIAVDMDFPGEHRRLSTWNGPLTFGGSDYIGIGALGSVQALRDGIGLDPQRRSYRLNLVDKAGIARAGLTDFPLSELKACRMRPVTEYLCLINPQTGQLIDDPEMTFEGLMSVPRRVEGPRPSIEIVCVSRLIMLDKADGYRWTDAHQQGFFFDGDVGFNHVDKIDASDIVWGGILVRPGAGRGGHPGPDDRGPVRAV